MKGIKVVFSLLALFMLAGCGWIKERAASLDPRYERRVDIFIFANSMDGCDVREWERELSEMLPDDQIEVSISFTPLNQDPSSYNIMAARLSLGEGTVWILPKDFFVSVAKSGAFLSIEDIRGLNIPEGLDFTAGTVEVQPDESTPAESRVYGIPLDDFEGLYGLFYPGGMVMAFPLYAKKNLDNALIAANWFMGKTREQ